MRLAIYCRVSTGDQNPRLQLEACERYAEVHGHTVAGSYIDVFSGSASSRPEFNRLLEDMRRGVFDGIVVTKLDRMGRSLSHLLALIEEFTSRGIHFMAVTQSIDTASSSGKMQLQVMGAFAEFERNLISDRTREALRGNDRVGKRGPDKKPRKKRGGVKKPLSFLNKGGA